MKYFLKVLFIVTPLLLQAESLKSLLKYAQKNNDFILSKDLTKEAKKSELQSVKDDYYPTVDIGGYYQRFDKANPILPGSTYSVYAKVGFDIYKGGASKHQIEQKQNELYASGYDYSATRKNITLEIVQEFYAIQTKKARLEALKEALKSLDAELQRIKSFFLVKLATSDEVDRLQATFDKNSYLIESLKFQILSSKRALELKVGKKIDSLSVSKFMKTEIIADDVLDGIKALRANKNSLKSASNIVNSYYSPQIRIEDTYNFYGYQDIPRLAGFSIEQVYNQNKIMLTLNMRVFDFGAISEKKEALTLQAASLEKQINYKTKEQSMQAELAKERIISANLSIKSSQSALKASTTALRSITKKYKNALVDYVRFLDALSAHAEAKAIHEQALNDLEFAYALYYYYHAKKLEEFLDD